MIGITVVIALGFLAMLCEVSYLVLDHGIFKEGSYVGLIEKLSDQQLAISKLQQSIEDLKHDRHGKRF